MNYVEQLHKRVLTALYETPGFSKDLVAGPRSWALKDCPTDELKRAGWYQWMAFEIPQAQREAIVSRHDPSMALLRHRIMGLESLHAVMRLPADVREAMFLELRDATAYAHANKVILLVNEIDKWWDGDPA